MRSVSVGSLLKEEALAVELWADLAEDAGIDTYKWKTWMKKSKQSKQHSDLWGRELVLEEKCGRATKEIPVHVWTGSRRKAQQEWRQGSIWRIED